MDLGASRLIWFVAVIFTLISGFGYFSRGVRAINANKVNALKY
jgi:hypothetical protein